MFETTKQFLKIRGDRLSIQRYRFHHQSYYQVVGWKMFADKSELLTQNAFDPVTVNSAFQLFFPDDQTQTCGRLIHFVDLIVQHQPLPSNGFPETKNG